MAMRGEKRETGKAISIRYNLRRFQIPATGRAALGFLEFRIILNVYNDLLQTIRKEPIWQMPHIVTEPCIDCKYTDCVEVCPVVCFHEDEKILVIDPYECIDCALCIPECPVDAIFDADNVPEKWQSYIQYNADRAPETPVISEVRPRQK